jgi:hypothetical protein
MRIRIGRAGRVAACAAAIVVIGVVLYFAFRDTSVVLAVPRSEIPAYGELLSGMKGEGTPRVRLLGFDDDGQGVLSGKRPGLAVVTLGAWTRGAISDRRLVALPAAAFPNPDALLPRFPQAFLRASGWAGGKSLPAMPLAFDPWLAFWHRDALNKAAPPADWAALAAAAARWKRAGLPGLALAGREPQALAAWVALLCGARGPAAAEDVFGHFPASGRDVAAEALRLLAVMERDGTIQPSAFSFPWQDAIDLLGGRRAAGAFFPLSRFRAMNPAASAPLIIGRVPAFPGTSGSSLVAEVRVLVMPSRGARGRGAEMVVAYLARPDIQRALADSLRMVPCRLDAPVRDGASFEGREAARAASVLLPAPGIWGDARGTAAFAEAAAAVLRSPGEVDAAVSALYGAQ